MRWGRNNGAKSTRPDMHVRVVYYDYATEEQPYCNTNTSCPRLPYHCLQDRYDTHTCLLVSLRFPFRLAPLDRRLTFAWPYIAQ